MSADPIPLPKLTKLEVAVHLLRRAATAFLEEEDSISALVLAGSAEDVLHGLLRRAGKQHETARETLMEWAPKIGNVLAPDRFGLVTRRGTWRALRDPFNWLRHADDESDPVEIPRDLRFDAACALLRATQNYHALQAELPLSEADVIRLLESLGKAV